MKQYAQSNTNTPTHKNTNVPLAPSKPSIQEAQLAAMVQRLNSIVEQQSRQIRRLENELTQLRESVVFKK